MTTQPTSRAERVTLASSRARAAEQSRGRDEPLLRLGAALSLLAAGVIHGAQIGSHLGASRPAGLFFAGVAALQVAFGVIVLASQSRRIRIVALVVTSGTIAVWIASRTVGIPIGGHTEAVGVADAVATSFEVVTAILVGALLLMARRRRPDVVHSRATHAVGGYVTAVAMTLAVAAVTAVALQPVPVHGHQRVRDEPSASGGNDKLLDLLDHHGSRAAGHASP